MEWTTYVASLLFIALQPLALHQSDNGELVRQLAESTCCSTTAACSSCACIGHAHAVDPSGRPAISRSLSPALPATACVRVRGALLAVAAMDGPMDDGDRWVESYHTRERIQSNANFYPCNAAHESPSFGRVPIIICPTILH